MFHRGVIHKITLAQFFCDTVYIGGTAVCQFLILNMMMMMMIWRARARQLNKYLSVKYCRYSAKEIHQIVRREL